MNQGGDPMHNDKERRAYQRSDGFHCEARVSRDKIQWQDAFVCDLSGDGLKFQTEEQFDIGEIICFDLSITGFLTNFKFITKVVIRHKDKNTFGASFEDLSRDLKIHIDEAVRNLGPKHILY